MKEEKDEVPIAKFDIRAEVYAAYLLKQLESENEKPLTEQVLVAPQGHAKRRNGFELGAVTRNTKYEEPVFALEVNRKGFYDTLPDGLFLHLDDETLDDIKRTIKNTHHLTKWQLNNDRYLTSLSRTIAIEQQTSAARKFFLPFEQALYWPRIETEQLEQQWTEEIPDFIKTFWGLNNFDDCIDDRQKLLLCYLLPESHRIAGDWKLTQLCFEQVLGHQVTLDFIAPITHVISESFKGAGDLSLGTDFIIGNSVCDNSPVLQVNIRHISENELKDYLPGGKTRRLIEELLYSYFLPFDIDVATQIYVSDIAYGFELGQSILGYNAMLPINKKRNIN